MYDNILARYSFPDADDSRKLFIVCGDCNFAVVCTCDNRPDDVFRVSFPYLKEAKNFCRLVLESALTSCFN